MYLFKARPQITIAMRYIILMFVFLCSCSTNEPKITIKREYYPSGKLKSEVECLKDTLDGFAKYYYENGNISKLYSNRKGYKEGSYTEYFENGVIKSKFVYYYGIPSGSIYFYYKNGKLERYAASSYKRECFYVMKFDSMGNKIKEEGLAIDPTVRTISKLIPIEGDSVVLYFLPAEPPGYISKVRIMCLHTLFDTVDTIMQFTNFPIDKGQVIFKTKLLKRGTYKFIAAGELLDTLDNWHMYDTAKKEIDVWGD